MFDIGFWELVILFGLGLMVLGPERMPQVAAKLGRWAGQARNMARHLTTQFREELEPIQKSVDSVSKDLNETVKTDWSAKRPEPGQSATENEAETSEASVPDKDS
jgi:sec-independent protein translocase protein TatB